MVEQSNSEFKRQVAYKCNIATLLNGVFVKKSGWESNYLMTEYGDFSRVNIIAVVVDKDENSITLDDGTGKIMGRVFDNPEKLSDMIVGDLILTIARPREYNTNIYLTIEIIRKIDKMWIKYRKKELQLIKKLRTLDNIKNKQTVVSEPTVIESTSTTNTKEKLIRVITQLDTGSGASIDDVIILSKIANAEEMIQDMLLKGEIFELRPGRLKLM